MTVIENLNPKVQYNGPIAINDALSINFPYTNTEDVKCVSNNEQLVYNRDYTILEQTLTIKIAIPQGQTITIYRSTPLDQQAEFPQNNKFNSEKMNEALDKICMQQQEQVEESRRSMRVPVSVINFDGQLPIPIPGKSLKINEDGTGFVLTNYDSDEAFNTTEQFKEEAQQARDEAITQAGIATTQASNAATQANRAASSATQANTAKQETQAILANATNTINAEEAAAISAIRSQQTTSVNAVKTEGTTQINLAKAQATAAANSASQANEVVQEAIDATDKVQAELDKKINITDMIPINILNIAIGQIIPSLLPITDSGLHLLDGSVISGDGIYKAFVDYIKKLDLTASYFTTEAYWQASVEQYGVCGKFVYDANANTVRLPKVTGFVEGTLDANALGDLIEAGLPNITGTFTDTDNLGSATGAFNYTGISGRGHWNSDDGQHTIDFDASRSNSIYGSSDTVQPQAIKGYYYIVVATSAKTDIEVDIDNIVTDLNQKVDISNMVDAGSYIAGCAMPSDKYVDLTYAANTEFVAPANGYFFIKKQATAVGQYMSLIVVDQNENTIYQIYSPMTSSSVETYAQIVPVKRGDKFRIAGSPHAGASQYFRFIYAIGSESEAQ